MIVLDASAAIEWLLRRPVGMAVDTRLREPDQSVHLPHLWAVEVAQVLRRLVMQDTISEERGQVALTDAEALQAERYPHEPLLPRVWQLRDSTTAYDAVYIALAEALDAPLLSTDQRLARAHGHTATIELLRPSATGGHG